MKPTLLVLRTPAVEPLCDFYTLLGARFAPEQHGKGPEHQAATLAAGFVLEIYPAQPGVPPDRTTRIGFAVADLPGTLEALDRTAALRSSPWGPRAVVHDPDGRAVELTQLD